MRLCTGSIQHGARARHVTSKSPEPVGFQIGQQDRNTNRCQRRRDGVFLAVDGAKGDYVGKPIHRGHSPCQKVVICQTIGTPARSMKGKVIPNDEVR